MSETSSSLDIIAEAALTRPSKPSHLLHLVVCLLGPSQESPHPSGSVLRFEPTTVGAILGAQRFSRLSLWVVQEGRER